MFRSLTLASVAPKVRCVLGRPELPEAHRRRLAELGLRPGVEVSVLHRTPGRGRVVAVGECRIALDRSTLAAIPVSGLAVPAGGAACR